MHLLLLAGLLVQLRIIASGLRISTMTSLPLAVPNAVPEFAYIQPRPIGRTKRNDENRNHLARPVQQVATDVPLGSEFHPDASRTTAVRHAPKRGRVAASGRGPCDPTAPCPASGAPRQKPNGQYPQHVLRLRRSSGNRVPAETSKMSLLLPK